MLWGALGYNLYYYWSPVQQLHVVAHVLLAALGHRRRLRHRHDHDHLGRRAHARLPRRSRPPFFRGEVLNADTPTLVPEDVGHEVGLFGIDESQPSTPTPQGLIRG